MQAAGRYSFKLLKYKDFQIKSGARPERRRAAGAAKTTHCTIVQRLFSPQYLFSARRLEELLHMVPGRRVRSQQTNRDAARNGAERPPIETESLALQRGDDCVRQRNENLVGVDRLQQRCT